jgi:hypothetical protein
LRVVVLRSNGQNCLLEAVVGLGRLDLREWGELLCHGSGHRWQFAMHASVGLHALLSILRPYAPDARPRDPLAVSTIALLETGHQQGVLARGREARVGHLSDGLRRCCCSRRHGGCRRYRRGREGTSTSSSSKREDDTASAFHEADGTIVLRRLGHDEDARRLHRTRLLSLPSLSLLLLHLWCLCSSSPA